MIIVNHKIIIANYNIIIDNYDRVFNNKTLVALSVNRLKYIYILKKLLIHIIRNNSK